MIENYILFRRKLCMSYIPTDGYLYVMTKDGYKPIEIKETVYDERSGKYIITNCRILDELKENKKNE